MPTDLALRALLPVAALGAFLLDAPRPLTGVLALAGLALVVDGLAALRRLGGTDRALVDVGGVLVALVLTGMLLGGTPIGLAPTTWVVALVVVSGLGLVLAALLDRRAPAHVPRPEGPTPRRRALLLAPWLVLAGAVVWGSVSLSATALDASGTRPVEAAFGAVDGTSVEVVVRTGDAVGPLEVRTDTGAAETSYPLVDLGADGTRTVTVVLPPTGRQVVTVNRPDQTTPLRTLVLDR